MNNILCNCKLKCSNNRLLSIYSYGITAVPVSFTKPVQCSICQTSISKQKKGWNI